MRATPSVLASVLRNSPFLSSRGSVQSVARACRFCAQDLLPRKAQTRFKKTKKNEKQTTRFFYGGFKSGQWAYWYSVREAKKRPLTQRQLVAAASPTAPCHARCSFFGMVSVQYRARALLLRKKKVGASRAMAATCLPHAPRAVRTQAPRWPKTTPRGFRPCRTR